MSGETSSWNRLSIDTAARYTLWVDGMVPDEMEPWLGGLELEPGMRDHTTQLSGVFADQSALLGVLKTLVHAGYALLSIECLGPAVDQVAGMDARQRRGSRSS